jgi:hypothetical protein
MHGRWAAAPRAVSLGRPVCIARPASRVLQPLQLLENLRLGYATK